MTNDKFKIVGASSGKWLLSQAIRDTHKKNNAISEKLVLIGSYHFRLRAEFRFFVGRSYYDFLQEAYSKSWSALNEARGINTSQFVGDVVTFIDKKEKKLSKEKPRPFDPINFIPQSFRQPYINKKLKGKKRRK
jgi:hypothetical protein